MHYGNPSIKNALKELRKKKCTKILVLPLYPQYSATTTASSFDAIANVLKTWRHIPSIRTVTDYADDSNLINSLAASIKAVWKKEGRAQHLLFSFHGIPKHYAKAGDPYPEHCHTTARLVAEHLKLEKDSWSIAFQSRLGRAEWLTPYTEQILKTLPNRGIKDLQVIAPGFAADCLETLEELAIRGKKQFLDNGGEKYHYIPALNDSLDHQKTLTEIIKQNLLGW